MSEFIFKRMEGENVRHQLLVTASAIVLIGSLCGAERATAAGDGGDHPAIWIELGGQLERVSRAEDSISPSFAFRTPRPGFETTSLISLLRAPRYAVGGEGKLTFEPSGSDWVFSAGVRYGRSNGNKHFHNQTYEKRPGRHPTFPSYQVTPGDFQDAKTKYDESHTVLDFSVGRDVGLGLFGNSVASAGVRYAQFSMTSTVNLSSKPDFITKIGTAGGKYAAFFGFHNYKAGAYAQRNFHGVGPSLSWSGATPLLGHARDAEVTLDWGINGALLFGRQRATTEHHTYGRYKHAALNASATTYYHPYNRTDTRSVTVPNVGGFAGLSVRYSNAKLSFGYRADVFFGAMDGGIAARKSYNEGFYGPFATISIGLGG